MEAFERTLILLKPDCIQRGLVGKVIERLERKGLKILGVKMITLNEAVLKEHYSHIADRSFFPELAAFMKSTPVIAMVWEGLEAVKAVRLISGITKSREADGGTIRGDFAMSNSCNVIHASDGAENAEKEIARFFKKDEIFDYDKTEYLHVYATEERRGR